MGIFQSDRFILLFDLCYMIGEIMNPWIFLLIAGLSEVGWALSLKFSEGFTKLYPSIITVILMILSFGLLGYSLKEIPIGTAYAIWTAIGAIGVAIIGMTFLGESKSIMKILCLILVIVGIVGLKLSST